MQEESASNQRRKLQKAPQLMLISSKNDFLLLQML